MHLPPAIAQAALYIDLKGPRGEAPVLLGVASADGVETVVLDGRFGDAAMARDLRVGHLEEEVAALLARSGAGGVPVVGLDAAVLATLDAGTGLGDEVARVFVAAADLVAAWARAAEAPHRGATRRASRTPGDLDALLAAVDRARSPRWNPRHTTPRLRYVEQQLQRHGAFDAITGTAKAKWTRLLHHCEADARGLRELTCELARRLGDLPSAPESHSA